MTRIDQPLTREAVELEVRVPLTERQRFRLWEKQAGLCGCGCGADLLDGPFIDEHVLPLWCGGTNALTNRSLWATTCSDKKTRREATERAKVLRLERDASPETRRRTKNPIRSRGFQRADPLKDSQ